MDKAKQTGEYIPSSQQVTQESTRINNLDLQKLADQLGMPSDQVLEAAKKINLDACDLE